VDTVWSGTSAYAADIDRDGDIDVLGISRLDNDIIWWENTDLNGGGTSWTEHMIDGSFLEGYSIYATDVDSDGDMDVLGASSQGDEIAWWENQTITILGDLDDDCDVDFDDFAIFASNWLVGVK
jgi:hypothetical protein